MSAISIKNLSKTYPASFPQLKKFLRLSSKEPVEALRNISLQIEEGEIFGLIGKNGAGKTTLTKIIATLVQPTHGSVSVKGFDSVNHEVKVRSLIGLATAEERSFYWRLSAEQNMMFFARLYGMNDGAAKRRIEELFGQLGLSELAKRRFSDLSTGNKQRLAIARALLAKPPVLLLDEPTRSLDPLAAAGMRELIASLDNVSILLTSHNLSEIEELCGRIAIIANGEIKVQGIPSALRATHKQSQEVKVFYEISGKKETLEFSREADDDLLSRKLEGLISSGAKILDIETQKATLLDVLESYEESERSENLNN